MNSSLDIETPLSSALERIVEIDAQLASLELEAKKLKAAREQLEKVAIEEMQVNRLDGVRVAGRSWRVDWFHGMSATEGRKEQVMEAARAAGWAEAVTQVNTAKLKSLIIERAKAAGMDPSRPYTQGSEFEGLVSEYVAPKLAHLTVG